MPRSTILLILLFYTHLLSAQSPFWQPSNGPYNASLNSIVQTRHGILFARTRKLVYRSTNCGAHLIAREGVARNLEAIRKGIENWPAGESHALRKQ